MLLRFYVVIEPVVVGSWKQANLYFIYILFYSILSHLTPGDAKVDDLAKAFDFK